MSKSPGGPPRASYASKLAPTAQKALLAGIPARYHRPNCYVVSSTEPLDARKVAVAVEEAFKDKQESFLVEKSSDTGHVIIQMVGGKIPAHEVVAVSLSLNKKSLALKELSHITAASNLVDGILSGVPATPNARILAAQMLHEHGELVAYQPIFYEGTTVHSGRATITLDLRHVSSPTIPPANLEMVVDDENTLPIRFTPTGQMRFCSFCKSLAHQRAQCPKAPECPRCGSTAHPVQRCKKSKEGTKPKSAAAPDNSSKTPQSQPSPTGDRPSPTDQSSNPSSGHGHAGDGRAPATASTAPEKEPAPGELNQNGKRVGGDDGTEEEGNRSKLPAKPTPRASTGSIPPNASIVTPARSQHNTRSSKNATPETAADGDTQMGDATS